MSHIPTHPRTLTSATLAGAPIQTHYSCKFYIWAQENSNRWRLMRHTGPEDQDAVGTEVSTGYGIQHRVPCSRRNRQRMRTPCNHRVVCPPCTSAVTSCIRASKRFTKHPPRAWSMVAAACGAEQRQPDTTITACLLCGPQVKYIPVVNAEGMLARSSGTHFSPCQISASGLSFRGRPGTLPDGMLHAESHRRRVAQSPAIEHPNGFPQANLSKMYYQEVYFMPSFAPIRNAIQPPSSWAAMPRLRGMHDASPQSPTCMAMMTQTPPRCVAQETVLAACMHVHPSLSRPIHQ